MHQHLCFSNFGDSFILKYVLAELIVFTVQKFNLFRVPIAYVFGVQKNSEQEGSVWAITELLDFFSLICVIHIFFFLFTVWGGSEKLQILNFHGNVISAGRVLTSY